MPRSQTDWRPVLAEIVTDILVFVLASADRKPANTLATDALARLAGVRLALFQDAGEEPTAIEDRHGMLAAQPAKTEVSK